MAALYRPVHQSCDAPTRVEVVDGESGDWFATFTLDAYTVALAGPPRRFTEGRRHVDLTTWIRIAPTPFEGNLDSDWLMLALAANDAGVPDILALAFPNPSRKPASIRERSADRRQSLYGPRTNGSREEGADFNDYLGIVWEYSGELNGPEARRIRALDCSGFVRMVYGYRDTLPMVWSSSVPLCRAPRADRAALPRRAHEMLTNGPGVVVIEDAGTQPIDLDCLATGDLLFFDADLEDGSVSITLPSTSDGIRRAAAGSCRAASAPTVRRWGTWEAARFSMARMYARALRAARRHDPGG